MGERKVFFADPETREAAKKQRKNPLFEEMDCNRAQELIRLWVVNEKPLAPREKAGLWMHVFAERCKSCGDVFIAALKGDPELAEFAKECGFSDEDLNP
ncbi:MAG: hypothetical protein QW303_07880 [Nitrososphaerota archaeon]